MSFKNVIVSSMVATAVIVAPVAAFAQTPSVSQSTGGREDAVDKKAMDETRMDPAAPGAATSNPAPAQTGAERGTDSRTTEPVAGAAPSGGDQYKKGDIAPSPSMSEDKTPAVK